MLNDAYSFNIQHSSSLQFTTTEIRSIKASREEANGVWWLPRSSKPLFRRGSVEGLVRFRRASANEKLRCWDVRTLGCFGGTFQRPNIPTSQRDSLRRRVRQEPHLHRAAFVRGVH